jgi:hypothetical protein
MASEKALYWMAVGLVALMAGDHFVSRFDGRAIAGRYAAVMQAVSGESTHMLAMATSWAGRGSCRFSRGQAAMARAQARMASMETTFARHDAACARVAAQRARIEALQQVQEMRLRVVVPNEILKVMPQVEVQPVTVNVDGGRI